MTYSPSARFTSSASPRPRVSVGGRRRSAPALFTLFTAALLLLASGGCAAPVLLAGSAGAAVVASDERSAGAFVEDQTIELKIHLQVQEEFGRQVNVNATSVNRRVLLTGQVPNKKTHRRVLEIVGNIENIEQVIDELVQSNPSSVTSRLSDSTLTLKVKTTLCGLQDDGFSCLDIKVTTENGVVYLMGLVTPKQEQIATDTTKHVGGVLRVETLFERSKQP